jgi:hypothetical protein
MRTILAPLIANIVEIPDVITMPPPDSDIDCKEHDGGVVIRIPPVGLWRAGGVGAFGVGNFVGIAISLGAFAALFTVAAMIGSLGVLWEGAELPTVRDWNGVLGLGLCWAAPAAVLLLAWHKGRTTVELTARDGKLSIDFDGPLRRRRVIIDRAELYEITKFTAEPPGSSDGPSPNYSVLRITTRRQKPQPTIGIVRPRMRDYGFLAGRTEQEIAWVADQLTAALSLTPPKPMTFWQWLKRDSAP